MTAPFLHRAIEQPLRDRRGAHHQVEPSPCWSFTALTEPSEDDSALVVYRLSVPNLGIDDLAHEVAACSGAAEGRRWRHERAREYVLGLRDQLRLHLSTAEIIVHATDDQSDDHLQVIVTVPSGEATETERLEHEVSDRVYAIAKRAWVNWSDGLRLTMAMLHSLENAV